MKGPRGYQFGLEAECRKIVMFLACGPLRLNANNRSTWVIQANLGFGSVVLALRPH